MYRYARIENGIKIHDQSSTNKIINPKLILITGAMPPNGSLYSNGVFTAPEADVKPEKTTFSLTNFNVTNTELMGNIYWIKENSESVITANTALPDDTYMIMIERVVDAIQVVDDVRFKAVVVDGTITINVTFKTAGNYLLSAERLNKGLERIGKNICLDFKNIEFDVYV